jgi:hypothetical protein
VCAGNWAEARIEERSIRCALRCSWNACSGVATRRWLARYMKEVDSNEGTVRFWQEIYDGTGKLTEIHEKYPVDKGHQKV